MQGVKRDASVLRRMALRARSRNEQVSRGGLNCFAGPRCCASMLWACGRPQSSASRVVRLRPTVPANGRFSLWPYGRSVRSMLHVG